MGIIGITLFVVLFRASNQLTCERLEKSHVTCQYKREYLLGLFSSSSPPFRLSTFDIQTKEVTYTDSDGNSHTTWHYHAYLTPKSGNEIFFHDYRMNYSLALKDQSKFIELGINQGSSEVTLERSFFLIVIPGFSLIYWIGCFIFVWFYYAIQKIFKGGQ